MSNHTKLQIHRIPLKRTAAPGGKKRWFHITISGGLGGNAIKDADKGHASCVVLVWALLAAIYENYEFDIAEIKIGKSHDTIANSADVIICIPSGEAAEHVKEREAHFNEWIKEEYGANDPALICKIEKCDKQDTIISRDIFESLMMSLEVIPQDSTNNIGVIDTDEDILTVTTQTSNQDPNILDEQSKYIRNTFEGYGFKTELM